MKHNATLVLKDGTHFFGTAFGYKGLASGEIVFNTSITGYQEILSDPSYTGQIVTFTYPQIGNVGTNADDMESNKIHASGLVIRELSRVVSNYRSTASLDTLLKKQKIAGIADIDTRALTRHIRDCGAQPALIDTSGKLTLAQLKKKASLLPEMSGQNLAQTVTCKKAYSYANSLHKFENKKPLKTKYHVVAYDFGVKDNILRLLKHYGCRVTVVPYATPAEEILKMKSVDGVFLSNGPGDPASCHEAIENVKTLLGKKPIFGICLGHQILALAIGAKTYKLKFGHRGGNQPVLHKKTQKVEITAQNHGFAVDPKSLPNIASVSHIHLNDETVSGIEVPSLNAFSVQYHPEASPGPLDSRYLFEHFIEVMNHAKA